MADAEGIPVSGVEELEKHLQELEANPESPLNAKLFDDVELQMTVYNTPPLIPRLLPPLTRILGVYPSDPAILVSLAIRLLRPIPFTQILTLASEESLVLALSSPAPSAALLGLTIIEKAAKSPSDAAILSIMQSVVAALIKTWLSSPSVEVGEKATKALGDLLEIDCDRRSTWLQTPANLVTKQGTPGQGLLWRRILNDREIYRSIFLLCDLASRDDEITDRQKSLAQARLLRLLPRMTALNLGAVTRSQFPDVEVEFGVPSGQNGLLYFAALCMVDKDDVLMHITLIDSIAELLNMISMTEIPQSTIESLQALMKSVIKDDVAMYKSLESLAKSANSPPELVELLLKLNEAT